MLPETRHPQMIARNLSESVPPGTGDLCGGRRGSISVETRWVVGIGRAPYETTLRRRLDSACQYVPDESLANLHPLNPEGRSHPYTNPTNWFRGVRTKKAGAIRTARLPKGAQLTTEAVAQ